MKIFPTLCFFALVASPLRAQDAPPVVTPETAIPNPVLPNPNGYDFYVRAGKALTSITPDAPVPIGVYAPKTPKDFADRRAYVAANAEALALLRQGFAFESRQPPVRDASFSSFRTHGDLRELASLLVQESRVRAADGNLQGAADSALDTLRLSSDAVRGGPVFSLLVSTSIESIGRRELQTLLPSLNLAQTRAAIVRLQDIEARRVSYSDVLREEKETSLLLLRQQFASDEWKKMRTVKSVAELEKLYPDPETLGLEDRAAVEQLLKNNDEQILLNVSAVADAAIEQARLPYGRSTPIVAPDDPLSKVFTSIYTDQGNRFVYERARVQTALLLGQLALRAFKLEHGAYPDALELLVPQYLAQVPLDPFGNEQQLSYKRAGERFTLYSIGPDGKDDGGQAMETQEVVKDAETGVTSVQRKRMTEESKGDIVAGIN